MRLLNLASATGISEAIDAGTAEPDDAFLQEIKTNNEVFASFRTHSMQNDIAKRMVDDKGELKSFSQFARDVRPYTDHQNRQWLRTEYNTAVTRAHQAADWRQFEAEKDVLPNLEWIPSSSVHPGADHRVFWGTVLPIDHPFWKEHRPGDRWNCKCSLRNTDKEPTTVPKGTSNDEANRGLENNPGKDGKLFSDKHPYMAENCGTCPFGNGKLWALAAGNKKNCATCKRLAEAEPPMSKDTLQKRYGKKWQVDYFDEKSKGFIVIEEGHGQSERVQNVKTAKPLAKDGGKIELIRQKTIRIDGQKKKIKSYDANVNGEKWEFKYTEHYEKLDKTIGTKANQAVNQGADVLLIDIHKTDLFSVEKLMEGVDNAFRYNETLNGICIMLESEKYIKISREYWIGGNLKNKIKKWLK